jgi:LacI family transcriptional regulator
MRMSDDMTNGAAITMTELARALGLATSTVSRALSNPDRVSGATRDRVVAAAKELGYEMPSLPQLRMPSGTRNFAFVSSNIMNPYYLGVMRGSLLQAKARSYRQLVIDTDGVASAEAAYLAELETSVDGIILASSRLSDADIREVARGVPLVTLNRDIRGVPSVILDSSVAIVHALDHLISLDHTKFAFLGDNSSSWSGRQRWKALQQAAKLRKVSLEYVGTFAPNERGGAAAADAAISTGATGCFFFNDMLAIGALRRFAERNVRVPQDLSVVGCDDTFGSDFCNPPLTTLTAPTEQGGRVATDLLLSAIQRRSSVPDGVEPDETEREHDHERLVSYLTMRSSTGPAPKSS